MFESVEAYLVKLRSELDCADPATVQDALADAEEHLRSGMEQIRRNDERIPESDALKNVIEQYGSPSEVAAAYLQIEARVLPSLAPPQTTRPRSAVARFFGVIIDPRAYASLFYMLFSLITGIIYFEWATTGMAMSLGMIVLIIGLPVFGLFLLSVQGFALVEGRIVEALLGVRMPRRPLFSRSHLGVWERFKALVSDKRSWTTILYMILQLPLGVLYFTLFTTMIVLGIAGIAEPILQIGFDVPIRIGYNDYYLPNWMMPLVAIVGALWILITLHLAKAIGRVHSVYAKALLVKD